MNGKPIKIIVFVLILVFYGSLLAHKIELPMADDMARHIKNGELILGGNFSALHSNIYSYTEPEHVFINHHWLSGVIFYLVHQAVGWDGLVIFKIIVLLAAFSILFATALKKADFWLVAMFSLPTILILGERTALRPEIFSVLFIAIFIYLLVDLEKNPERNRIYWLIPMQLLWVNMHIFFVVGIALVVGFLLEKLIYQLGIRKNLFQNPLIKKLVILLALLILVSFINPNGWRGALYPLQIFNNYGINVGENNPPSYFLTIRPTSDNISIIVFYAAVWFLAASFFFNLRKRHIFYFLASAATAVAGLRIFRAILFFGLMFLPAVSANLNEVFVRLKELVPKSTKTVLTVLFMLAISYLTFLGGSGKLSAYNKPGIGLTAMSQSSAEFFKEQNLKGPIFNDYDIGSYLIYHFYPQEKVFVDNRPEAYSASFLSSIYSQAIHDDGKWQELLGRYQFNAIFMYQYDLNPDARDFIRRRIHDPSWALVYIDPYAVILLKNNLENREAINKFLITSDNIETKLEILVKSASFNDQVAAADIFNLLGRPDLEMKAFLHVVNKWPEKGKIWMIMGVRESVKNPDLAITYLEKAISTGYKTADTYVFLGGTYMKIGEYEKAKEALKKALKINPKHEDAKKLLLNANN